MNRYDGIDRMYDRIGQLMVRKGALLVGHMEQWVGPHEGWWDLVKSGHLREVLTPIGPVIGIGQRGRDAWHRAGHPVPYLTAPGALANRALMVWTIAGLEAEGYEFSGFRYQRSNVRRGQLTSIALSATMHVPEQQRQRIEASYVGRAVRAEDRGQPLLYTSVRASGMRVERVRVLLDKTHRGDIAGWRAPLMVAVLDDSCLASLARQVNAHARALQRSVMPSGTTDPYVYDRIRVIRVELPECRR